jgi:CRISPR-associated protein Cas5d
LLGFVNLESRKGWDVQTDLPPLALRVRGPLGCFTRPELKAERFSYPVITPSAARGVLEAVLWKPAIRWRIERIKVLARISFTSFRRNEVGSVAAAPTRATITAGGPHEDFYIEDRRQQRNTVALRDVDYVIEARIEMTDRAGAEDNKAKFVDMFRRRVEKAQHFHQPYLGCREFVGEVLPVDMHTPAPIDETRDLGLILWDIDFGTDTRGKPRNRPRFFAARLINGVLEVPVDPDSSFNVPEATDRSDA